MDLKFSLNGTAAEFDVSADTLLVDFLRDAGYTGTKEACGVGVCGACTVLVNNRPVSSCTYLVAAADGADVWTVEGLTSKDPRLLEAFVEQEGCSAAFARPVRSYRPTRCVKTTLMPMRSISGLSWLAISAVAPATCPSSTR